MQDAKEEVRARLNIEDVIGEYVQLKRAGRNFKGLSPFTSERTPSFFVSPDKHIWHDFSSNKGGDVFSFVMQAEGMDFRQALEHLARKAGVDLSLYETKGSQELAKRRKRIIEAHEKAVNYYQHSMLRNKTALEYIFTTRGLSKEIVTAFRIGYAPDSGTALLNYLTKQGYSRRELTDAGLVGRYGKDTFRGRMMVPLMDASGQVIGFTGRIIGDVPNAPKYLNTPQTVVYDKSRHVFGFSQAKEAIRQQGYTVIVEGNLDVVSSHQVGVRQVVATAGTAMTEYHLRALKRLSSDVRLAYDGDKAGIAATERAIGIASSVGVELTIISLPDDAKDPDELIQRDPTLWTNAIDEAQPAVDWVLDQYSRREDLATAAGKRAFTTAGLGLVKLLTDPVEREHYEQKIASMVGGTLATIRAKLDQTDVASAQRTKKSVKHAGESPPDTEAYQDNALAVAMIDGPSQELLTYMNTELFHGEARQAVAKYLAAHHGTALTRTPPELNEYDTYVKILLLKADTRYAEWGEQDRYFETARLIRQIEHEYKKQTRDQLTAQLREAEAADDESRATQLRAELNTLIKEIARGKR